MSQEKSVDVANLRRMAADNFHCMMTSEDCIALLDAYEELAALQAEVREHFELMKLCGHRWYVSPKGDVWVDEEKLPAIARALRGEES